MSFLWLRGIQGRGYLKDTAFSRGKGGLSFFFYKLFRWGMRGRAAPGSVDGDGLGRVPSQASCPLTTEGPVARAGATAAVLEECPQLAAWRPVLARAAQGKS